MSDYQMLGDLNLKNLLDRFSKNLLTKLNCVKIGKIKTFYPSEQNADIQIEGYPLISAVPVSFIFGGDFSIQIPVKEGDDCIILFCDGDLDNWVEGKGYVPAFSQDKHGLNGAVALVGLTNLNTKINDYITDGVRIKYKNSSIEIKESGIVIDGNVTVNGTITSVGTLGSVELSTHIHAGVQNGGGSTDKPTPV